MTVTLVREECGMCHETREPATWCHDGQDGPYAVCEGCFKPSRRMVAVTIAISEPTDSPEINWPFLLSALVRTHFNSYPDVLDHDVIRVIDAWRADQ